MDFRSRGHRFRLLGLAMLVSGCGGEDGPPIYPVSGKVLLDGKPASKAQITFHAASGPETKLIPFAETDAEGAFKPSTRLTGDGAPAGDYTLTIICPEIKVDRGEEVAGRDRLGGKYNNSQASNLKVTIRAGENVLPPFDLKSSR